MVATAAPEAVSHGKCGKRVLCLELKLELGLKAVVKLFAARDARRVQWEGERKEEEQDERERSCRR